jgi:hypothetical protein
MSILDWNASKVRNLTGAEIWLFILARLMIGFGLGVLACQYLPQIARPLAVPALVLGVILFLVATKGLPRTNQ